MKRLLVAVLACIALTLTAGCGGSLGPVANTDPSESAAGPVEGEPADEPAEETTAPAKPAPKPSHKLSKDDWQLTVKVLDSTCYGSGEGASIEYRVQPKYVGPPPKPTELVELTYKVKGDESGDQTGTISIENGKYETYEGEGYADTSSCSKKLTATVTAIETFE